MKRLRINHLHLHLKGVSPSVARAALSELGPALLKQLAAQDSLGGRGKVNLGNLEMAKVRLEHHSSGNELQRNVVQAVVDAVVSTPKGRG